MKLMEDEYTIINKLIECYCYGTFRRKCPIRSRLLGRSVSGRSAVGQLVSQSVSQSISQQRPFAL